MSWIAQLCSYKFISKNKLLFFQKPITPSKKDNFEWARGINERFGLHWMNYTDPNHQGIVRLIKVKWWYPSWLVIPKKSARFLGTIARTQCVPSVNGYLDNCSRTVLNEEL